MDYIKPAQCTETQFRTMWTEFEWENKVNINSKAKSLREFLTQLMACTNMSCLTPEASMKGDCQFLSANLYARSVFGKSHLLSLHYSHVLTIHRRGCPCKLEHRERGRQRSDHRICPHSQSFARVSIKLGVAEGVEQGWRCVNELLMRSCHDNVVRQRKYESKKLDMSSIVHHVLVYVVGKFTSLHNTEVSANIDHVPDRDASTSISRLHTVFHLGLHLNKRARTDATASLAGSYGLHYPNLEAIGICSSRSSVNVRRWWCLIGQSTGVVPRIAALTCTFRTSLTSFNEANGHHWANGDHVCTYKLSLCAGQKLAKAWPYLRSTPRCISHLQHMLLPCSRLLR